ncbi:hypothetical protein BCR34DRAFT_625580 [Clohesyomyces aquaticus]|uniref:Uncharacterized protein n=1 Tax=Clohesyomyces aquaticus TaxID=1231657 RepID=A0A1Y1ZHK9_9PLEO|nr:hypothetical protein BCR34DRAFT_625580 [Clohesyomyces aquaticus]
MSTLLSPLKELAPFTQQPASTHPPSQAYIIGLRGLFVLSSFLYTSLLVLAPNSVAHSPNASASSSRPTTLHKALKFISILFWNSGLIYSASILLSARTLALPFLTTPSSSLKSNIAGCVFRRGIRLWIPVAVGLGISVGIFKAIGYEYIDEFARETGNTSILVPYKIDSFLVWFNSVFNLFWVTNKFAAQSASYAFPGQMLWAVGVVYMQSFTVYMTMVIIPYTRPSWRIRGAVFFILTAWWVQSWAWYSITGLLLADLSVNMSFKTKAQRGIPIYRSIRLPSYVLYFVLLAAGLVMQYLWVAWRPSYQDDELRMHGGLYYTGGLNEDFDVRQPQARDDNYLVLLGFMLCVETSDILQCALGNSFLVYLGRRSLSWFLVQCIVVYTLGIKLYQGLHLDNSVAAVAVCFFSSLATTVVGVEVFYRSIEVPSQVLSHKAFDWIKE